MKKKIRVITVNGKEWFDKVNGNSYHSVVVHVDERTYKQGFTYGYGEAYIQTAVELLQIVGELPANKDYLWRYCEDNGIKLNRDIVRGCKKRDLKV